MTCHALSICRLNEMKAALGSKLLYGQNESLDAEVNEVLVASEGINELLDHLHKMDARPLVITSRDRTDVLWTLLTAHSNPVGPRVAGILLTSEGTGPTWVSVCVCVCLLSCAAYAVHQQGPALLLMY